MRGRDLIRPFPFNGHCTQSRAVGNCLIGNFLRMQVPTLGAGSQKRWSMALHAFDGPVIVYSAYEQTRLRELAGEFPDLGESLNAIIARLVDLLPIVRGAVYFPEFDFSNSIKSVAPALCPGFGYDDLEDIADGAAASAAFLQLASGCVTDREETDRLRAALLAYCRRDTLAMVQVHRALMGLASNEVNFRSRCTQHFQRKSRSRSAEF